MKTTNRIFTVFFSMLFLLNMTLFAQEEDAQRPQYVVVTTMHWNMDNDDFNMDEWKAVEKEFLNKVTMKNELIMGASVFLHRYTADNTELIVVQSYASWEDIDKAGDRNGELIREAWPNEDERSSFFEKRNNYYSDMHSDEIYATMSGARPLTGEVTEDLICYVRRSHFAFPDDGTGKEFSELRNQALENVVHKNEYIKGYYPSSHAWGADRTEYVEAFFVESMEDLEKMQDRNGELFNEHWSDEAAREEFVKKNSKYYTGVHGDYIYTYVAELAKR